MSRTKLIWLESSFGWLLVKEQDEGECGLLRLNYTKKNHFYLAGGQQDSDYYEWSFYDFNGNAG